MPIGPDSSRIIAEIVAVGIDQELEKTFTPLNGRYYRNVDDLVLGLRRRENAASCLSSVAEAFSKFELEFNSEKTRELGADEPLRSLWVQYLGEIENASNVAKQGVSIRRFFEGMFELQRDHPTDNVVRYAIAKASSVAIASENWSVFQQFLIRAARAQSSILDLVALLTFEAVQYKKPVDKAAVLELVGDLVEESVPTGRDYELMWALLICRELNLALGKDLCGAIQRSSCSLAIIIALDLERRGLAKFADKSLWQSLVYGEGLWSRSWMLAYESRVRSWLKPKKSGKWAVKEAYFVDLAKKKVRFYSPTMNPVRLGGLRKALAEQALFGSY